jgi:hypothetical protein
MPLSAIIAKTVFAEAAYKAGLSNPKLVRCAKLQTSILKKQVEL